MTQPAYNFNAGPAILPRPVLEQAAAAVKELPGTRLSLLEISHRSPEYSAIHEDAQQRFATLTGLTGTHKILLLQGGASLQFSMVPQNLMPAGGKADYVITGSWSKKAAAEARHHGTVNVAASTEEGGFCRIPTDDEIQCDAEASYLHYTTNNTIFGTQWVKEPASGDVPLVADASSDILSRPMDFASHGVIYAGAQKNLGPAGVTLVAVREDLLSRTPEELSPMLSYALQAAKKSLYNTPPVFPIYVMARVLEWIETEGGLAAIDERNRRKAAMLYNLIDASGFYRGHAEVDSRSSMNVTFRLPSEDLDKRFLEEASEQGFVGLKGHRSVGGCRASIYNAFPLAGVEALASFMKEFQRTTG
ncbi:MAG: 3-phosphoserine/phosphohydroxythreonine transaminase [Acidobacteria bacterium]|nr:MAG: 3-phosphoserine/phosphohydroxythreonine transaminase [Acidobacteriota bacterium]